VTKRNIDVIIFTIKKREIKDHLAEEVDLMSVKNVVDLVVKSHHVTDMNEDEINIQKNNLLPVDLLTVVCILPILEKLLIIIFHPQFVFTIKGLGLILLRRKKIRNKLF
jgi:hypothetical protein